MHLPSRPHYFQDSLHQWEAALCYRNHQSWNLSPSTWQIHSSLSGFGRLSFIQCWCYFARVFSLGANGVKHLPPNGPDMSYSTGAGEGFNMPMEISFQQWWCINRCMNHKIVCDFACSQLFSNSQTRRVLICTNLFRAEPFAGYPLFIGARVMHPNWA